VNSTCFRIGPRHRLFDDSGTTGVSKVCGGVGSCTAASYLQAIKTWYYNYCAIPSTNLTTTSSGPEITSTRATATASASSLPSSHSTSSVASSTSPTLVVVSHGGLSVGSASGSGMGAMIKIAMLLLLYSSGIC
jgi:hypothetical protein